MTPAFVCSLLMTVAHVAGAEPKDAMVAYLDLFPRKVAIGEVHRDWPVLVVAEILPTQSSRTEKNAESLAARFTSLLELDPPNGMRKDWAREYGFYLCGPPGHPDDRFELADVVRQGRKLTVTIESWPTGRAVQPGKARRRTGIVAVKPLFGPGEYEMTVIWRDFAPNAKSSPFWSLKVVRRTSTKFTVYEGKPPAGARAVAVAASDFRPVPVEKGEATRLWAPVPTVQPVLTLGGFAAVVGDNGIGVVAGTFDPREWKSKLYSYMTPEEFTNQFRKGPAPLALEAPIQPAKPTDPLYAVIYAPQQINGDHCQVRAIEWADGGFVLHVQFFHTGWVSGSNFHSTSAYVVPLPVPEITAPTGRKPLTGKVPVTVRWTVLHGQHVHSRWGGFRPLGPGELIPMGFGETIEKATEKHPRPAWLDKGSRGELTIRP